MIEMIVILSAPFGGGVYVGWTSRMRWKAALPTLIASLASLVALVVLIASEDGSGGANIGGGLLALCLLLTTGVGAGGLARHLTDRTNRSA